MSLKDKVNLICGEHEAWKRKSNYYFVRYASTTKTNLPAVKAFLLAARIQPALTSSLTRWKLLDFKNSINRISHHERNQTSRSTYRSNHIPQSQWNHHRISATKQGAYHHDSPHESPWSKAARPHWLSDSSPQFPHSVVCFLGVIDCNVSQRQD